MDFHKNCYKCSSYKPKHPCQFLSKYIENFYFYLNLFILFFYFLNFFYHISIFKMRTNFFSYFHKLYLRINVQLYKIQWYSFSHVRPLLWLNNSYGDLKYFQGKKIRKILLICPKIRWKMGISNFFADRIGVRAPSDFQANISL